MANEPQRQSEGLLRAWAAKRRAESGTPQLHPATRRMLQAEVARTHGTNPAPAAAKSWLAGFWPRIALAGCSVAAVVVLALVLWPESRQTRSMLLAKLPQTETREAKPADSLAESASTVRRESDRVADKAGAASPDPTSLVAAQPVGGAGSIGGVGGMNNRADESFRKSSEMTLAGGTFEKSLLSGDAKDASAPSPTVSKPMSGPAAAGAVPALQLAQRDADRSGAMAGAAKATTKSAAPLVKDEIRLGLAPMPVPPRSVRTSAALGDDLALAAAAPMPAPPAPVAAPALTPLPTQPLRVAMSIAATDPQAAKEAKQQFTGDARTGSLSVAQSSSSLRFTQADDRGRLRKNFNSPAPAPVLNDFQFERTGNTVRITDGDGSVYTGQIVSVMLNENQTAARGLVLDATKLKRAAGESTSANQYSLAPQAAALPQTVLFRVQGTNLTSGQRVEFEGNLLIAEPQPSTSTAQPTAKGAVSNKLAAPVAAPPAQIQGRAFIGREQIEIRANATR